MLSLRCQATRPYLSCYFTPVRYAVRIASEMFELKNQLLLGIYKQNVLLYLLCKVILDVKS